MHVPRGARVWLKTGSAELTVTDVTGGLDLNVVGGSITVHGNPRELRAESMDGAVTIDGVPEWMRVKTATGDIALRGGQDVGASTISGTIDARGGEADHLKLESTTGTIRFALALARGATVEMETHSGPIEIQLPRKTSVDIDAATVTGEITNAWSRMKPERRARGAWDDAHDVGRAARRAGHGAELQGEDLVRRCERLDRRVRVGFARRREGKLRGRGGLLAHPTLPLVSQDANADDADRNRKDRMRSVRAEDPLHRDHQRLLVVADGEDRCVGARMLDPESRFSAPSRQFLPRLREKLRGASSVERRSAHR